MGKFAIILILSLILIMGVSSIAMNKVKQNSTEGMIEFYNRSVAQNLANSYANIYVNKIHEDTTWTPSWSQISIETGIAHKKEIETDKEITLIKEQLNNSGSVSVYAVQGQTKITAIANVNSIVCSTIVIDNPIPYSYYAWFLNVWPQGLYLGTNEGVLGPVFSNQFVSVGQIPGPVIDGNISCVNNLVTQGGLNRNDWLNNTDQFKGDWLKEGVDPISFNANDVMLDTQSKNDAFDLDNVPSLDYSNLQENGRIFVNFLENGEIAIATHRFPNDLTPAQANAYKSTYPNNITIIDTTEISDFGHVFHSNNYDISVKGIVSGQITLSTDKGVMIEDDVIYENDPREDPTSTDLLSIMSKADIQLAVRTVEMFDGSYQIPNNNSSSDTLAVMANMTTLGKIGPEMNPRYMNAGDARGTWWTYGSRVQKNIMPTWAGNNNSWQGFKEFIEYDERLRNMVPPGMPYTNNRRILSYYETL